MECRNCPNLKNCQRQCMNLPAGKTCADCRNVDWCMMAYGVKPENTSCDFEPIRFREKEIARCDICTDKGHCPEYFPGAPCVEDRKGGKQK